MSSHEAREWIRKYGTVDGVREWANCREASIDTEGGDTWVAGLKKAGLIDHRRYLKGDIAEPQGGHWLSDEGLVEFVEWCLQTGSGQPVTAVKFNERATRVFNEGYAVASAAVAANLAGFTELLARHASTSGGLKTAGKVSDLAHVNAELCKLITFLGGHADK